MKAKKAICLFLWILGSTLDTGMSHAQTAPTLIVEASRMDQLAGALGDAKVTDRLSSEFSSFLGTDARTVVPGLRNGTPIILTRNAPSSSPGSTLLTTTATITPPTGKMGFGNVFIALALARQQLSQLGIAQPTPEQLQAALVGGAVTVESGTTASSTNLAGILTLRSHKMGWGQIAQELGFKLGPVVGGLKATNDGLAMGAVSGPAVDAAGGLSGAIVDAQGRARAISDRDSHR